MITLNMNVMAIKIKPSELKNILIKLDHNYKILNDFKRTDWWKIQLVIAINCMFSKDNDDKQQKQQ